ncbi:MAG: hypothetical protein GY765_41715 [bacterium]|nr:hypothetical protein [bacterium]
MKKWILLLLVFSVFMVGCGEKAETPAPKPEKKVETPKPKDPRTEKLEMLAKELKTNVKKDVEIPFEKLEEYAKLLLLVLPETTGDLAGYEWDVSCNKNTEDHDMLFAVNLNRKKGEESEQAMWFHIIYNAQMPKQERDEYGTESFEGYKATVSENAHLWVLVNNMEIRAVADAEDFKNDVKIQAVLKAFKLKDIEKL